jgi:hypothetical protein
LCEHVIISEKDSFPELTLGILLHSDRLQSLNILLNAQALVWQKGQKKPTLLHFLIPELESEAN